MKTLTPLLWRAAAIATAIALLGALLRPHTRPIATANIAYQGNETGNTPSALGLPTAMAPSTPGDTGGSSGNAQLPRSAAIESAQEASANSGFTGSNTTATVHAMAARIQNPYAAPPETFSTIDSSTRAALVNILCTTAGGPIRPISGSGVIIDPRGIILTNAHIAQYVLLSEDPSYKLNCIVRSGSPARPSFQAVVLYIPPVWVSEHAGKINAVDLADSGEHDYGLLLIKAAEGGAEPSAGLPYLSFDTRERVAFTGDQALVASYPVGYTSTLTLQNGLLAATSQTTISALLTFGSGSVDLLSLAGIVEAQSGSSGGAIVNAWGYLVGLITTTTGGATPNARDLHALTLSYIDRDIKSQSGSDLSAFLAGDLGSKLAEFNTNIAPALLRKYVDAISSQQ